MRKMLISTGPSEQPLRVLLPADETAAAIEQRGRRARALSRHRSARPSRAMKVILRGLRATLMVLMPRDLHSPADEPRREMLPSSSVLPGLHLVRDCGRALDVADPAPCLPSIFSCGAMTPRHHLRHLRGRRRRC
ncbi:conserved hypothetical protein [Bradyrhizobium sp. ORS 375]|uniref:hypothetical protein n=1 Tax=Bradyrhizobium sp. (strain ORS 375) TaxID=566679 RepID=UPI0002406A61|nr:hypothetical protein [Bradyrhizobium sp. ORS 375]CCD95948.1 conserved hypothetical protein [Bradyrhizobium sp. ORS 375]